MKLKPQFALISILVFVFGLLSSVTQSTAETLRVPKSAFPACAQINGIYCIESVVVTTPQGMKIPLLWVPSGNAVPAATTSGISYAPMAVVNKSNVVTVNNWWLSQEQRDSLASGTSVFLDVSSLIGTSTFPAQGAIYDSTTKTFDTNRDVSTFSQVISCFDPTTKTSTNRKWSECYKGAIVVIHDGQVIAEFDFSSTTDAATALTAYQNSTFIDTKALALQQQMPALNARYNVTSQTFDKLIPLVIPLSVTNNAYANGWDVAGMVSSPSPSPTSSSSPIATSSPVATPSTSSSPVPVDPSASPTGTPTATESPTAVISAVPAPISEPGRALTGRWTSPRWTAMQLDEFGYDGLFVDAKSANEFTNNLFVDVVPTLTNSADNKVSLSSQPGSKGFAVNLDPSLVIKVTLRTGQMEAGITVSVGVDTNVIFEGGPEYSKVSVEGTAVTVPLAKNAADCETETGIAKANVRQFQTLVIPQNDQTGFGIDGISGRMYVGSNGVCSLSSPIWDQEQKSFSWQVGAPHFGPDGVTVNRGFYKAVIPFKDAALLWGLTNPADAASALTLTVSTETGGSSSAISVVSAKAGNIIVDVSGFSYSRPKLTIKLKKGYKPSKAKISNLPSPKKSIICGKGAITKSVTAVKPSCPKGYTLVARKR